MFILSIFFLFFFVFTLRWKIMPKLKNVHALQVLFFFDDALLVDMLVGNRKRLTVITLCSTYDRRSVAIENTCGCRKQWTTVAKLQTVHCRPLHNNSEITLMLLTKLVRVPVPFFTMTCSQQFSFSVQSADGFICDKHLLVIEAYLSVSYVNK